MFSQYCTQCRSSMFLRDCIQCQDCFLCVNLVNRQYCIRNVQYLKEEYFQRVSVERIACIQNHTLVETFWQQYPYRYSYIIGGEKCDGNDIIKSKECHESYSISDSEDIKYTTDSFEAKDVMDVSAFGAHMQLVYDSAVVGRNASNILFCDSAVLDVSNLIYCFYCALGSHDLFACSGLRNKSYCILNKQYTKEEYESLVPKIIAHMRETGEWGEFFPASISPFGYNETVAQEYFPMTREEALAKGFNWSDYEPPAPQVSKTIPADRLPDRIEDIPDDILNWAIVCEVSGKPFRIIRQELEFYRKHQLPIPRRHPDQRHLDRMSLRNPRKLFERKCDKC